jgi:Tfp pilus assembly protein PilF
VLRNFSLLTLVALLLFSLAGCGISMKAKKAGETHYALGLSYLKENNSTLALKEFLLAADANPGDPDIQAALGQSYQLKKAFPQAEQHYKKALQLRPGDPQFENNLGALYLDMKRWDDAIHYFGKAADNLLFTHPEIALTGMGFAHFQKGDYLQATTLYKEALAFTPRYPVGRLRLGEAYAALDKPQLAIAEYRKALSAAPDFPVAQYQLGLSYMKIHEAKKAETAFREVLRLAPDSDVGQRARDYLKTLR